MKRITTIAMVFFILHAVFMLLASTKFTIVTCLTGSGAWQWNYYQWSYRNGFGYAYVSEYSALQILAYLLGYGLGFPVFACAWKCNWRWLALPGFLLCGLGFISFLIEATHIILSHHLSLIASFPVLLIALWIPWLVMIGRARRNQGGHDTVMD